MSVPRPASLRFMIRTMTLDDLETVMEIEDRCFLSPWTPDLFIGEFENPHSQRRVAVREEDGEVIGYMIFWIVLDEGHLMSLAVDPDARRQGVGEHLLTEFVEICRTSGVVHLSLEVRKSNGAALELYLKHRFLPIGLRKGYYSDLSLIHI